MESAPFHADLADGPVNVYAVWLRAGDGIRIRTAIWPGGDTEVRGTVLLFQGRTEYVEKYGRVARELNARGYAVIAPDWRGQGLSDRLLDDPNIGHIGDFAEYQRDIAAMLDAAAAAELPRPWHLIAHSLGGAIGLRALMNGLPVSRAVFSAPMWGIAMSPLKRPFATILAHLAVQFRFDHHYVPGGEAETYVRASDFRDNTLTSDTESWAYMRAQVAACPELSLGGPSLGWLHAALVETRALRQLPSPQVPSLVHLGTEETIVAPGAIRDRMARWPGGHLEMIPGAEHEIMMESPEIRNNFFDAAVEFFSESQG